MKIFPYILILCTIGLSGCAHDLMRGSVAMKVNDQEGHVCLGNNEVKVGDKVALYKNDCTQSGNKQFSSVYEPPCKKIKIGDGEITRVLNEHYSVVKADPGTTLQEGFIVEKYR